MVKKDGKKYKGIPKQLAQTIPPQNSALTPAYPRRPRAWRPEFRSPHFRMLSSIFRSCCRSWWRSVRRVRAGPQRGAGKTGRRNPPKTPLTNAGCFRWARPSRASAVKFYLVAMLFILFDIEIVFMYAWAAVYRDLLAHGSTIFWSMLSFVAIITVGYVYAIKKGVLDWKK